MSASGGGGGGLLEDLRALLPLAQRVENRGVRGAIVSFVLGTFITIFIIRPAEFAIAYVELAGDLVSDAFATAQQAVASAFDPVYAAILGDGDSAGVIDMAYSGVETAIMDAGLGAPFAATLTAVIFAAVLTVTIYVLIRVTLDLIPGAGGLIP